MHFPALHSYLSRLPQGASSDARLWKDAQARVQGQFFQCTLTSRFQPVRDLDGKLMAFEAHAFSDAAEDRGLPVEQMLKDAASDDESIELDRLCRIIHVLNFFQQIENDHTSLQISVHERLLASVSSNHGAVFGRILDGLNVPRDRITLQLPQAGPDRQWLIGYVVDNYRRNGFKIATCAATPDEALRQILQLRPDLVRLPCRAMGEPAPIADLLEQSAAREVTLLFSGVDTEADLHFVRKAIDLAGVTIAAQQGIRITGAQAGVAEATLIGAVSPTASDRLHSAGSRVAQV